MNLIAPTIEPAGRLRIVPARDIGEAVNNLLQNGWTRLAYPALARRFDHVVSTFTAMTLDDRRDDYVINDLRELDEQGERDLGLIEKARGQVKLNPRPDEIAEGRDRYDSTKFVHQYKPRLLGYLSKKPGAIERHAEFFLENACMYSESTLLMLEIMEELDRQLPGFSFAARFKACDHDHLLRLLRYLCDGPPDIAQAHRDKNFITLHPRSDCGGLWVVDNNGRIIKDAEETRDDSVLLFFGRKAWEATHGKISGIIHGVKDRTYADAVRIPRHTAVGFGHVELMPADREFYRANVGKLTFPSHVKAWMQAA
jgi:hypothetical protein